MDIFNNVVSMDMSLNEDDKFSQIEAFHRQAILEYEQKLSHDPKSVGTLCDWIASYHELALVYKQKGAVQMAQKCLLIPHQSMLYMAKNNQGDVHREDIATRAIGITLPPLLAFAKEHPPCDKCLKALKSQLAMIQQHKKTDH
ncbi:hypothetical protein ACR30L_09345 [Psychromonas sp. PT13]|uniref:hypothetical protein n=1 Tax=Psychromonas sp. PT13 TaxID=3439547 RepID=UPI003EBB4127